MSGVAVTLQIVKPGVLRHWCPGCAGVHEIDIHAQSRDGHVTGWDGDFHRPTIPEVVRHSTPQGVCEYVLRGGVLTFTDASWHGLAGQQRHLEEFPSS